METDCQNWWFQNRSPKRGVMMLLLRFPVVGNGENKVRDSEVKRHRRGDGQRMEINLPGF